MTKLTGREAAPLERMEAKICCAYNATRSAKINSTVTVADSAREPLKVLKVLVEGLARDSKSSLWLTPLEYAPQLTRLFPFDFAYLDKDMKVLEAVALRPETPAPRFRPGVASALILPFGSLKASGTEPGDAIVVCTEEELEAQLAGVSAPAVAEPVPVKAESATAVETASQPPAAAAAPSKPEVAMAEALVGFTAVQKVSSHPLSGLHVSAASTTAIPSGTGFTLGTTSGWRLSTSTTTASPITSGTAQQEARGQRISGAAALAEADVPDAEQEDRGEVESGKIESAEGAEAVAVEPVSDVAAESDATESLKTAPVQGAVEAAPTASGVGETEPADTAAPAASDLTADHKESAPTPEGGAVQAAAANTEKKAEVSTHQKAAEARPEKGKPAVSDPFATRRKGKEEKKKESLGVLVKRFLNCEDPPPERRAIIRLLVQGMTAYTGEGETRRLHEVRDVSPLGLYLRTDEGWRPNDVVLLTLERKGATEAQYEKRVRVKVKVVRRDEGGVGFSWLWPEGVDFEPWKRVHTKRSDETDADYFLRELRLTTAIAFLSIICPEATEELKLALHKRLSNKRVASAVEIVLKAQDLYGRVVPGGKAHAHPDMVRRVLENGSWTEDDWIRLWWAGLLVSACSTEAPDTSNSVFVDLLAKLMPVHLHLLDFVCMKSAEQTTAHEGGAHDVFCTSEELIEAAGSQSIARIQQSLGQLSSLGLLAESNKPSYVAVTDKVKTLATPTALGLKMHARCNGHR